VITINLLVNGQARRRTVRPILNGVCLVATCAALATGWWYLRESRTELLAQSLALERDLAETTTSATRFDQLRKRQSELVAELATVSRILEDRSTSTELFEAISRSLTDGLWLTEVRRSAGSLHLDGRSSSLAAITGLVRNLGQNLSFVRPPEIASMSTEGVEGSSVLRFQVAGELASVRDEARP
jgi:type IV pilus assembly protein PilN